MNDREKLVQAIALLESAITDFRKLTPYIGEAATVLVRIYSDELEKLK